MLFGNVMFDDLSAYGYVGIIVYMILTGCGLPTPEEVAIIGGGVAASLDKLDWRLTLGSLLIGAIVGDSVMYGIGRYFGQRLLQKNRLWSKIITPEREKKVEQLLLLHGVKVLLVTRFLVGLRGPMYITAGILRVPYKRFVIADAVCASLVVTLFFGLSYFFGAQVYHIIRTSEGWLTLVLVAVVVIAAGIFLWYELRKKKLLGKGIDEPLSAAGPAPSVESTPAPEAPVEEGQKA